MKFLKKQFSYGQKGFTLIELLIVVAVLGILAAVIVPNLATFLKTGKVAAANTELANVESAALAYYADHSTDNPLVNGGWPANDDVLEAGDYISSNCTGTYAWASDGHGKVSTATYPDLTWDGTNHKFTK